jgi:hypothetical protein
MFPHKLLLVALVVSLASASALGQSSQSAKNYSAEEILNTNVAGCTDIEDNPISFNVETTITKQLFNLHECLNVPVGIVFSLGIRETRYKFKPSGQNARSVLDSIVAVAPAYKWSVEDGVINLVHAEGYPPLLDYRLTEFKADNASTRSILDALENMSEVRKRAAELGFDGPQVYTLFIGLVDTRKYNLSCRACSVRDVLNSISRLDGSSWMYAEYLDEGEKEYRFGFFTSLYAGE